MKLQVSKSVHYDSGPNMTPLVDVVMVILIFLMLAGSFGAASHFLPGGLLGKSGVPKPEVQVVRVPLEVFVNSPSPDTFHARLSGGEAFSDAASLTAALAARRAAHEAAGSSLDDVEVVIAPRQSTRFGHVTAVYEAAMEARWPRIGFKGDP